MLPQFFEEGREKTCVWFTPGCKCALGMTPTDSSLGPARLPVDHGNNPAQYMPPPPVLLWRQPNGYHPLINDLPLLPDDFDAEPYFRPLSPSTAPSLESSPEPSPGLPPVELPAGEVDPADEGVEHAYEGMRFADEELNPANEEVGHADEGVASADEEVASESEEADSPTCVTIIVRPGVPEVRNTDQDGQKAQGPEEDLEQRLLPEPGSCFCLRPDYWQNMVQCEGEDHPGGDGWYHYSCAGLAEEPPETGKILQTCFDYDNVLT